MNDFLTKDRKHLRLFQDNIVIDKRLLKWRRAEDGIEKTNVTGYNENSTNIISNNTNTFFISNAINTTPDFISDYKRSESFDPDSN